MPAASVERGCTLPREVSGKILKRILWSSIRKRSEAKFIKIRTEKSAEVIVPSQTYEIKTDHVVGCGRREGKREGLNDKRSKVQLRSSQLIRWPIPLRVWTKLRGNRQGKTGEKSGFTVYRTAVYVIRTHGGVRALEWRLFVTPCHSISDSIYFHSTVKDFSQNVIKTFI